MQPLLVYRQTLEDAALDMAFSHALLLRARAGQPSLRISRPQRTLAFSRRDRAAPGFALALAKARAAEVPAVLRLVGGRCAALHPGCLNLALSWPLEAGQLSVEERFASTGQLLQTAFAELGVETRQGPLEGEYCPGDFTFSHRGRKLAGLGQRLVRGASQVGVIAVAENENESVRLLEPAYRCLGEPFDPWVCGSLQAVRPDLDAAALEAALLEVLRRSYRLEEGSLNPELLDQAEVLRDQHALEAESADLLVKIS